MGCSPCSVAFGDKTAGADGGSLQGPDPEQKSVDPSWRSGREWVLPGSTAPTPAVPWAGRQRAQPGAPGRTDWGREGVLFMDPFRSPMSRKGWEQGALQAPTWVFTGTVSGMGRGVDTADWVWVNAHRCPLPGQGCPPLILHNTARQRGHPELTMYLPQRSSCISRYRPARLRAHRAPLCAGPHPTGPAHYPLKQDACWGAPLTLHCSTLSLQPVLEQGPLGHPGLA